VLAATIAIGVALDGFHAHDDALGLARGLALMTLAAGAGAVVAAWRPISSRRSHRSGRSSGRRDRHAVCGFQ
jgi:hypothetical protein